EQKHMHKPQGLYADPGGYIYVAEGRAVPLMETSSRLGRRVIVLDQDLNEVTRMGHAKGGEAPDQFLSPHGLAVDSAGSIYVAEAAYTALGSRLPLPQEVVSVRKWRRAGTANGNEGMPEDAVARYLKGLRMDGPGAAPPIDSRFAPPQ